MRKKLYMFLALVVAILLLSGCDLRTVGQMYCLPKRSDAFIDLQKLIDYAMDDADFSAPLSGNNLQAVQTADLDGNGKDEYLVFAKGSNETPMHIYIFAAAEDGFVLLDSIESTGAAFDRVEYADMDNRPGLEIIVGRQIGEQVVRSLSVYTLIDGQMEQLLSAPYTRFLCTKLDADAKQDLFVLRPGTEEPANGIAELYSYKDGSMIRYNEASMSQPSENIKRLMVSKLYNGTPAVFVASAVNDTSIVTDIFTMEFGLIKNVTLSGDYDSNVNTLRNYFVYADDIDFDGVLELPNLLEMKMPEDAVNAEDRHLIRWYSVTTQGSAVTKMYTYHNFVGSWYLSLDPAVAERITVSKQGNSYMFSIWNEDYTEFQTLMTVYVLTGQKREEQATTGNRFVLRRTDTTVYAATLEVVSAEYGMSQQSLINDFHLIRQEWNNGIT